jgi:hypothetical protein
MQAHASADMIQKDTGSSIGILKIANRVIARALGNNATPIKAAPAGDIEDQAA